MLRVLLDTTVIIDLARGKDEVIGYLNTLLQTTVLYISVISMMEILMGARNKIELQYWSNLIKMCTPVPLSESVGTIALGLIQEYHHSHGLLIPDALIAATALTEDLPLYTANKKHFKMIPHLRLY